MEENNIDDQQFNQYNDLAPNSLDAQNETSKQNSGSFHNENIQNDVIMKNRLNMIRNNFDQLRANAHLFDKVNQRKNMPQENRNGRKNRENDQVSATENTEDNTTEKKSLKDQLFGKNKDNHKEEDSGGEGSKAINSLFNKDKKEEDPTEKAVKGSLKLTVSAAMMPIMIGIVTIFFILLLVLSVPMMVVAAFSPLFAVSDKLGFDTGGEEYSSDDKEEAEFTERLSDVMEDYDEVDQETVAKVVSGVFAVVNSYNEDFGYDDMTKSRMKDVSDMLIDNDYDAEKFKEELASDFLPKHIKGLDDEKYLAIAEEVYEYIEGYHSLIGDETKLDVGAGSINQCSYNLSSVNYEGGKTINSGISPSNIKVRLMQEKTCGGTTGNPIEGEELVDFEKYVLGVAYAEIGDEASEEAFKAQLIVARSFALVNAVAMKRNSLKQENGQWIMEITNCNADQYYCDPDKGCSWDGTSGNLHAISGTDGPKIYKQPLAANAPQRNWAVEVMGKVAVDANNRVFWTTFTDTTQTQMKALAAEGKDYTTILVNIYKDDGFSSILDGNCQNVSNGIYSTWKQNNPLWANIVLGGGTDMNKSLGNIGCLVTSIAILIQKSGVLMMEPTPTMVSSDNFTPGTFASALNQVGAFNSIGELTSYTKVTTVVPKFSWHSSQNLSGMSKADKLAIIKEKSNLGLYCVVQVLDGSTNGTHFVALDYVDSNDNIKMIDPGAADYGTDMWQGYDWKQTAKINCYEVK